jgi:hypothetical protein
MPSNDPAVCRHCQRRAVATRPDIQYAGLCEPCNAISLIDDEIACTDWDEDRPDAGQIATLDRLLRTVAADGGNWRRVVAMNGNAFPGEATEEESATLDALAVRS